MVHQIILNNIAEDFNAYTYIKPHIKEKDVRNEFIAPRECFENYGMLQERVLKENITPRNVVYCDERQMTFERFSTNFQTDFDTFADDGQDKYRSESDIIDELWPQIQCPGLVSYIDATKIAQLWTLEKYKIFLQNIATHLPSISGKTNISRNVS